MKRTGYAASAVFAALYCCLLRCTLTSAFSVKATTTTTLAEPSLLLHQKHSRDEILAQQQQREFELRKKHDFDTWNRLFVSVKERPDPVPLCNGESALQPFPADFPPGCLLRLGPNGAPEEEAFMDGDGMIHCITFPPNNSDEKKAPIPHYSATYVKTRGRSQEEQAENKRFKGTLCSVPRAIPMLQNLVSNAISFGTLQAQKDTCNTALAISGSRVLALMEQCPPCEISIEKSNGKVTTVEHTCRLDGTIEDAIITGGILSAHGRTDPQTGERVHVSYQSIAPPYLRVDTFAHDWKPLGPTVGVDVPAPVMLHDCCLTEHYVVLFDFPLTLRTSRFLKDQFPVEYEPDNGARIGLLPRSQSGEQQSKPPIWFDCIPGVILHGVNAFERTNDDGDEVVVVQALRSEPSSSKGYLQDYASSFLYEYELNLKTGQVVEGCLNTQEILEFPVINDSFTGKETEAVYCNHVGSIGGKLEAFCQPETGITLNGVTKLSLVGDTKGEILGQYSFPENWYCVTEPTVVSKTNGEGEYVILIATQVLPGKPWRAIPDAEVQSRVIILDGDHLNSGPVWVSDLPYHVPYGLHSSFVPWEIMK